MATSRKAAKKVRKKRQGLYCVDLFAGAGGFSLAAQRAGFSVKLAVEADKHACATYRHNFKRRNVLLKEEDITGLAAKEVAKESFKSGEHCDLLLGGPPCQGFTDIQCALVASSPSTASSFAASSAMKMT